MLELFPKCQTILTIISSHISRISASQMWIFRFYKIRHLMRSLFAFGRKCYILSLFSDILWIKIIFNFSYKLDNWRLDWQVSSLLKKLYGRWHTSSFVHISSIFSDSLPPLTGWALEPFDQNNSVRQQCLDWRPHLLRYHQNCLHCWPCQLLRHHWQLE